MQLLLRPFALALALLVVSACATTQEAPPREAPRSPTFLWKVTAEDKPGTVYLLGTVHLRAADDVTLDRSVLDAVDGADRLVLEVVPDDDSQAAVQALTMELGFLPEGESLLALVDDETRASLERVAADAGLPLPALERMRPWLAAITLAVLRMQREGYTAEAGVEHLLLARVRALGQKETHSLESFEEQLRLFADLAPDVQLQMLRDSVEDVAAERSRIADIAGAYRDGDDARLRALLFEGRGERPEAEALYQAMFDERNVRMVERMQPWLDDNGSTVVAVGAGHVLGAQGIPALLLAKGYRVEAVPALGLAPVAVPVRASPFAFVDEELGFAAVFQTKPEVTREQVAGPGGHTLELVMVSATLERVELSVVVNRFPMPLASDPASLDRMFTALLDGMGHRFGALESSERLTVHGLPAARFTARDPTHLVDGLVVVRGGEVFSLLASRAGAGAGEGDGEAEAAREAMVRRFFESFELLEEAAAAEPSEEVPPQEPGPLPPG